MQPGGRLERNICREARPDKTNNFGGRRKSLGRDAAGADLGPLAGHGER